jgi:hypothetical protein
VKKKKLRNEELHRVYPSSDLNWNDQVTEDNMGRAWT